MTSPHGRSQKGCDSDVVESQCLNPREEFAGSSAHFLWASDLERDNRVLFRYTATCSG
jgi:hypothetical protein